MSTEIVGSKTPTFASDQFAADNPDAKSYSGSYMPGYGQNNYGGASSDMPGHRTGSGFLPGIGTPVNNQLRKLKGDNVPTAFGMKKPDPKSL